jgi:DNA-binding transcriptional ArsR family regulator
MVKYEPALDRTLTAIADPTRRRILARLGSGAVSMTELAEPLAISLPGLMKHVRILEAARLVETRKNGRTRQCRLGPARMDDVAAWVDEYRERWEARLDRLESYLEKKKGKKKEKQEGGRE